jgi:CRP-like cAMP-binding protein
MMYKNQGKCKSQMEYTHPPSDRALEEQLIARKLLTREQLQTVMRAQQQGLRASSQALAGLFYEISLEERQLTIRESVSLTPVSEVPLARESTPDYEAEHYRSSGHWLALVQGPAVARLEWHSGERQGLVVTPEQSFLYLSDLVRQQRMGRTQAYYSPWSLIGATPGAGPYDLYLAEGLPWLGIIDRYGGELFLLNTGEHALQDAFSLRAEGSLLRLDIAFDSAKQQIFAVDGINPYVLVLDPHSGALEQYSLGREVPRSLVFDPLHRQLWLLIAEPHPRLRCLDADSLHTVRSLPLAGLPLTRHPGTPGELMTLSPDGQELAVVTLDRDQHPLITRLAIPSGLLLRQQPMPSQELPFHLAYAGPNPMLGYTRPLAALLLEQGLIDEATLTQLGIPLPEEVRAPEQEQPAPALPAAPVAAGPRASLLLFSPIEKLTEFTQPRAAENLPLPQEAEAEILAILTGSFYRQAGIDLSSHPEALTRLAEVAHTVRIQLQDFDAAKVDLPDLIPGEGLQTVVLRASVVTMMALHDNPVEHPYKTPPTHCPACHQPLLGSWDCEACGLELEGLERAMKRKVASVEYRAGLPVGYFAVPDRERARLLLINTQAFSYVTWQLNLGQLALCQDPVDILWLQGRHVLVTDYASHQVFECDSDGKIVWHFDTERSDNHHLKHPVKATMYHTDSGQRRWLIVDQGHHRVFEVDERQQITWHFGQLGVAGHDPGQLNSPCDIQYTHERSYLITDTGNNRILEILEGKVYRTFGAQEGLNRPVSAQRLFNGHTLICDAGNHRLLELDASGTVVRSLNFQPLLPQGQGFDGPVRMLRRENRNVVLVDRHQALEVDLLSGRSVWSLQLDELGLERPEQQVASLDELPHSQPFATYDPPPPPEIVTIYSLLQQIPAFSEATRDFFNTLEESLRFRIYKPGDLIVEKGKLSRSMYLIQNGLVEMLSEKDDEPFMTLGPGDVFGFMAVVYPEVHKASLRAAEHCEVYELEKKHLDRVLAHHPAVAAKVQDLAAQRLVMARLKQSPQQGQSSRAHSRLQSLIAEQKARAAESLHRRPEAGITPRPGFSPEPHRLRYSDNEKGLIQKAHAEQTDCYELHITLSRTTRMKAARLSLVMAVLDKLGTIILTEPSPEDMLEDRLVGYAVSIALLTKTPREQLIEDLMAISEVDHVDALPILPE